MPSRLPVVVVGAGVAGLACARALADGGLPVVVLERDRHVGGRLAARRAGGTVADLGAQYVTATDAELAALLRRLAATGLAEVWATRLHRRAGGRITEGGARESGRVRWAFPDGMPALARQLAGGLTVHCEVRVQRIVAGHRCWQPLTSPPGAWQARALVLALPAPDAVRLLDGVAAAPLAEAAGRVRYQPCWALAAGYPDAAPPTWRGVFVEDDPVLAWVAHDSSKRVNPPGTVLVAHGLGDWSRGLAAGDAGRAEAELVRALGRVAGRWAAAPAWTTSRRWPHAQLAAGAPDLFLLADGHAPLGLCGDWCGGPKVEGAWRSGRRLAAALLERLAER